MNCFGRVESESGVYYASAIPMEIPPIAMRMHISISTIKMIIFVDFFISLHPFRVELFTV